MNGRNMEQYELHTRTYFANLRQIFENFSPQHIYIRGLKAPVEYETVLNEELNGRRLLLKKTPKGITIVLDGVEKFLFETGKQKHGDTDWGKDWAIAYHRVDEQNRMHFASTGYDNPDDPALPTIKKSVLRCCNYRYMVEITFDGKIPLRKAGLIYPDEPHWYYWKVRI